MARMKAEFDGVGGHQCQYLAKLHRGGERGTAQRVQGTPLSFLASAYESTILSNNYRFKVLSKKGSTIARHQVAQPIVDTRPMHLSLIHQL